MKDCKDVKIISQWRTHARFQNLLRFNPTLKASQSFFIATYNNKARGPSSNLIRRLGHTWCQPKDLTELAKRYDVVYKIQCERGKVDIGETGRAMKERIKELEEKIRLARTQNSAVSENINETGHVSVGE